MAIYSRQVKFNFNISANVDTYCWDYAIVSLSNLCEQRVVTKPKNLSGNPVIIKLKRQRKKNCIFPSFISKEKTYSFSIFWVHINQFCRLDVQETFVEPKQSLPWNFEAWKLMENEFIWQIICKHIIIQFAFYLHMQKMH